MVRNGLFYLKWLKKKIVSKGSISALYRTRDYLCPAFMELCVNLKCLLACV